MAFADLLINAATIRRWTDGGTDNYGNPVKTWADHLIDQPCRIAYPRGRQIQRATEVVPVEAVLFIQDVDVTEHDRAVMDGTEYEILFVATLQNGSGEHHLELLLTRVIA